MQNPDPTVPDPRSGWKRRLRYAVPVALAVAVVSAGFWKHQHDAARTAAPPVAATPAGTAAPAAPAAAAQPAMRLADFGALTPSPDARLLANWIVGTRDHKDKAIILVDKKDARVYVFTPDGRLKDSAPVLLGQARGDEVLPGAGEKEPAEMKPHEKTTPAGRFVAEPGRNADNEDVIWVDYDDAISLHRIRPLVAREQRLQRLASPVVEDNRISFGCINVPVPFYENVARPTVAKLGAIIYVMPEVKTLQEVFGAYDVTDPAQVAAARQAKAARQAAAGRPATQG